MLSLRTAYLSLPIAIAMACLSGCSSSTLVPAKLVPVCGLVQLDGTPLTGTNVIFIPRDNTKGTGGSGVTDADGKYQARHPSNTVGIEPGTYSVLFSKITMPDGSAIPPDKNAADVGAVESLPPQLSNPPPEFVTHIVTISESGGSFDFTLASK